jgi:hypothetical protein
MKALLFLAPLLLAAAPQTTPAPFAPIDGLPIDVIPKQELPTKGCSAYLWTIGGTRALVAMAGAEPARLRVAIDGKIVDLDRSGQVGAGGFGFADATEYGAGPLVAKLTIKIETRESLTAGAIVPEGTLQIDRTGQDSIVLPVAGIIGCAT